MSDLEKARDLFTKAGLAFPTLPPDLASKLTEREKWVFSTHPPGTWTYVLDSFIEADDGTPECDYAVLSHAGYGGNSYAIQYYLVYGPLRMFLHLAWGGAYMDHKKTVADIRDCFTLADKVVLAAEAPGRLLPSDSLLIVGSHFYGSYWTAPGQVRRVTETPTQALQETLDWLQSSFC